MQPKSPRFADPENGIEVAAVLKECDKVSTTVAFGHREIHVHLDRRRRLSIYEAMLIQGLPEFFVMEGNLSEQVEQVSNAIPPPLAYIVAISIKSALKVE